MTIAHYICWQLDSTLRPTMKHGFDIIPALLPELILDGQILTKKYILTYRKGTANYAV